MISPALNVMTLLLLSISVQLACKPLETVSFVYKYSTCVQEDNQQGDASSCKDAKTCAITPELTAIDINCAWRSF
jgi:hypothetical protein